MTGVLPATSPPWTCYCRSMMPLLRRQARCREKQIHGQMLVKACWMAAPFDFIRCDFYEIDGEVYFSEFAVYPKSGHTGANRELRNLRNALWDLRRAWFLTAPQSGWRRIYATALERWLKCSLPPLPRG